jgi:hypothetical protein
LEIRSHNFSDFHSVLKEFESGHGLNLLVSSDILGFIDIDLGKDDTRFLGR